MSETPDYRPASDAPFFKTEVAVTLLAPLLHDHGAHQSQVTLAINSREFDDFLFPGIEPFQSVEFPLS